MVRPVRIVALRAVLADRRVFEEERTALLGVALVAELVDRVRAQHLGLGAVVGVVAARAAHLPLAYRVVRGLHHLGPLGLVARGAGLGVQLRLQLGADRLVLVDAVALGAGHVAARVHAGQVVGLAGLLVALQARGVELVGGELLQGRHGPVRFAVRLGPEVVAHVLMAVPAALVQAGVLALGERRTDRLVVTGLAVFRAPRRRARARLREGGTAREQEDYGHERHGERRAMYENPRSSDHLNLLWPPGAPRRGLGAKSRSRALRRRLALPTLCCALTLPATRRRLPRASAMNGGTARCPLRATHSGRPPAR